MKFFLMPDHARLNRGERDRLLKREVRAMSLADPLARSRNVFSELTRPHPRSALATSSELRLRSRFSYRGGQSAIEPSDRKAPPRAQRPPATRILSPRGAALRLELLMLALAQGRYQTGTKPPVLLPVRSDPSEGHPRGLIDLLASTATPKSNLKSNQSIADKKVRQVESALDRLQAERLIGLPGLDFKDRNYNSATLFDESDQAVDPLEIPHYALPDPTRESTFALPAAFITKGWVHILEDTEIALLLMVACRVGNLPNEEHVAIPAGVRQLGYGLSRDTFSLAHKTLWHFGLLEVHPVLRHDDGRAIDYNTEGSSLHRLELLPEGFQKDPNDVVPQALRDSFVGI